MPCEQRFGFRTAMQFDVADDDIGAVGLLLARRFEHGVALAHARRCAEEYLQAAAPALLLLAADARQQRVGIGAFFG